MRISFEAYRGNSKNKPSQKVSTPSVQTKNPTRARRLIFWSIFFILLGGVILYFSNPDRSLAEKSYNNKKAGFSIQPPKDWPLKESKTEDAVKFTSSKTKTTTLTVNWEKTNLKLSSYIDQIKEILPKILPGYGILNEFDTTIQGHAVHIINGEVLIKNVWKKDRVLIEIENGKAYSVAASSNLGDWSDIEHTVNSSLNTFKVSD